MTIKHSVAPTPRRNEFFWNVVLLFVLTYLEVFGYVQLAKPFCSGEPHTLPESYLTDHYPCDGSLVDKVLYLAARPWRVYSDYLRLQHQDSWVSASALCMLLRLLLALLWPAFTRFKWVTVAHRIVAPLTLLGWVLKHRQEPSVLALWFVRSWPLLDCAYVLVFPTTPGLEAMYAVSSFVISALLGVHLYARRLDLVYTLATCVISSAWIQYVLVCWRKTPVDNDDCLGRRRRRLLDGDGGGRSGEVAFDGQGDHRGRCGNSCDGAATVAAVVAPLVGQYDGESTDKASGRYSEEFIVQRIGDRAGQAEEAPRKQQQPQPSQQCAKDLQPAYETPPVPDGDCGPRKANGGGCGGGADFDTGPAESGVLPIRYTAPTTGAVRRRYRRAPSIAWISGGEVGTTHYWTHGIDTAVPQKPLKRAANAAAGAAGIDDNDAFDTATAQQGATAAAASCLVPAPKPRSCYVPVVRLVRLQLKIHGADPDQVQEGYESRISHIVAAAGYELDSVYMRQGCIELVINAHAWQQDLRVAETGQGAAATEAGAAVAAAAAMMEQGEPAEGSAASAAPSAAVAAGGGGVAQLVGGLDETSTGEVPHGSGRRLSLRSGGGGVGNSSAVLRRIVVVDVRAAAAAASRRGSGGNGAESGSSGSTALRQRDTSNSSPAVAPPPPPLPPPPQQSLPETGAGDAGPEQWDLSRDVDIGAIIRALRLDLQQPDFPVIADGGEDGSSQTGGDKHSPSVHDSVDGSGVVAAAAERPLPPPATTAAIGARRVGGPWTQPAALLLRAPPQSYHTPQPQPQLSDPRARFQRASSRSSSEALAQRAQQATGSILGSPPCSRPAAPGAAAAAAAAAAATTVPDINMQSAAAPAAEPWQVLRSQRPAAAAAAAAAAAGLAGSAAATASAPSREFPFTLAVVPEVPAVQSIQVWPRVLCPAARSFSSLGAAGGGSGRGSASGAPEGTVFGPFHLDVMVRWRPVAQNGVCDSGAGSNGAAAVASSQRACSPDQLQLLLRSRGLHLPARVLQVTQVSPVASAASARPSAAPSALTESVGGTAAAASGCQGGGAAGNIRWCEDEGGGAAPLETACTALLYSLEVPYLPVRPGLLLMDVLGVAAVPVALLHDPEVAAELQAAIERWEGRADEMEDLLYDISTYVHGVADAKDLGAAAAAAAAAATSAAADGRDGRGRRSCHSGPSLPLSSRVICLGYHLLNFSIRSGWSAFSSMLQDQLSAAIGMPPAQPPAQALATAAAASAAVTSGQHPTPVGGCADGPGGEGAGDGGCAAGGTAISSNTSPGCDLPVRRQAGKPPIKQQQQQHLQQQQQQRQRCRVSAAVDWVAALLESPRGCDEEDFRSYKAFWRAAQAYVIQWMETLAFLMVLWRLLREWRFGSGSLEPTTFTAAVSALGTAPGLASTAAWLVLPREMWMRVAGRCVIMRQASHCLAKLLLGWSPWRPLPCVSKYEQGLAVWLLEGVVLPGASLLSPAASLLMAAARAPLLSRSWLVLAGGTEPCAAARSRKAVMRGCGLACLSVATSLACHWCLCQTYRRRQHRRSKGKQE